MKGVVFLGDRKLELREFPDPTPGPRDVILEIKASGMCGSDLHNYRAPANPGGVVTGGIKRAAGVIAGIYFQKSTGTRFPFAPYRGAAPLYQDMLAGRIDFVFGVAASTFVHVRNGDLKVYAVMAKTRWAAAPDIPTIDEAGVPGLYASYWHGLWVPKGTPKEPITRLNSAVQAALADATVQQRLADQGYDVLPREQQTPEALAAQQKAEIEKWWPILKAANIKGE